VTARTWELLQRVVCRGDEADDVLRGTVAALVVEPAITWAGIAFVENGELRLGPTAGVANEAARQRVPIVFEDALVAELWVDGQVERAELDRIATVVAPYALIGWDTAGEAWDP
jgi:putative methionine-R-sulfoxide reductase with GAF domain